MRFDATISFPGLGIEINPSTGFSIFNFEVKWYAVIIASGLFLAVLYALLRSKDFGLNSDDIMDLILIGTPCAIVGARTYYVIFEWERFFVNNEHWYDFLNIRQGGLAIYGAVIGAVIGLGVFYLSNKKRRQKLLPAFDIGGLGLLIGQSIGRWGNFINREAHGGPTDSFLRMGLETASGTVIYVHPTFLYESLWNAVGFVLIHFLSKKRKFDGQVFLYYLIWYGLGRAWIEGMRTDSLYIGPLRVSQVLAIVTCLAGAGILLYVLLVKKPDGSKMLVNRQAQQPEVTEVITEERAEEE